MLGLKQTQNIECKIQHTNTNTTTLVSVTDVTFIMRCFNFQMLTVSRKITRLMLPKRPHGTHSMARVSLWLCEVTLQRFSDCSLQSVH